MTIPYDKIGKKIYDILAAANYNVEMFDNQSNKTYDVETARKFFIVPGNSMVSVHDSDDDEKAKISVSLSPDVDIAVFEKTVGKALKLISAKYGQNMGYSIRKFGHELQPRDFAHQIKKVEEESAMVNKTVSEARIGMTGTTRSSYQKVGECKVIIRHTDKVNEDKFGARSRNINAIFVETKNGERFKVAENNLHGARAMARHLSNGGSPFDTVGIKVSSMMEEMSSLKNMMAEVKSIGKEEHLIEQSSELAGKIRTRFIGLRETLRKMSGKVGYFRQTADLTEDEDLDEYDISQVPAVDRLRGAVALTPPTQRGGKYTAGDKERMKREAAVRFANKRRMAVSMDDIQMLSRILSSPAFMNSPEYKEYEAKVNEGLNEYTYDPDSEPESGMDKGPKDPEAYSSPAQELVFKMQDALSPPSELDHGEWVLWSRASEALGNALGDPENNKLGKDDMRVLFDAAQRLGVNIRKRSTESIGFAESIQENKNVDGEMDVEEKSVDKKTEPKEDEVPNMMQTPEFDRPTRKAKNHFVQDLVRDNSEGLHSVNYYKEGVAPEETMLEEWFNQMSDVEFFKEEELIIKEDKTPKVKKILSETAAHRLNLYVGHPLFEQYIGYYEERKMFDDILNFVEEDSKLWNTIAEARERLTEFVWGDLDPQIIEDAVERLKELKSERRTGMKDAIDQLSQEISDGHLDGTDEAKEVVAREIWKRADEEGLIKHDFGSKFADAALSNNDVIAGDKAEIDAEQYYGPAKFGEADAPMDAGRSDYTATIPPEFDDREPPECRKCGEHHEGPCPLYDAKSGLRQVSDQEIQAIWGARDVETKRQLSLELIQDFHFKDEASRRHEMNKLNALTSTRHFDEWAKNMLLHGEDMGFGTGRGPRRREDIEYNSEIARISELAGLEKNDEVEEDAASEKKLGRRKAGSYGRPGSKKQKQMASKSSRREGKADIEAKLKNEDSGAFPGLKDVDGSEHGIYGRRMKPLPAHPDEEENFNAHTDEDIATFGNMPLLLDQKKEAHTDEDITIFDNMPLLLDQKKEELTDEPEIAEDFNDEVTLSNMPLLLKQEPEQHTGEPELSEDGARIIQLARYRT